MRYDELMVRVRGLLRRSLESRYEAGMHTDKVQVTAYADGYMRALKDAELLSEQELRDLVIEERQRILAEPVTGEAIAS